MQRISVRSPRNRLSSESKPKLKYPLGVGSRRTRLGAKFARLALDAWGSES